MRIITYVSSVTDDAPERYRCAARLLIDGVMSPMVFHGADKPSVRQAAQAWWDEQVAAEQRKGANRAAQAERMRRAREARGQGQGHGQGQGQVAP